MIDFWNAMNQKSMMTNKISIDQLFQNEFFVVVVLLLSNLFKQQG